MHLLQRWPIGRRLAFVLAAILGLSLLSSVVSVVKLRELGRQSDAMVGDSVRIERAVADWMTKTTAGVMRAAAIAKSSDPSLVEYFAPASAKAIQETNELQKVIEAAMDTPEEKALFEKISGLRKSYLAAREEVSKLKKAGEVDGAAQAFKERFEPTSSAYLDALRQLVDLQRSEFDAAGKRIDELRAGTVTLLVLTTALSLGVGAVLAWLLTRSITAPLAEAEAAAQAIAEMDLSAAPAAHYGNDETGRLMRAIDAMRAALRQTVGQVRGAVESISTASQEIAAGSHDLSQRTEQAAANLQQTASAMEQLTGTVRSSADAAEQANQLAGSAAEVARRGGDVVGQVVSTMDEINQSSRKIADIIGVIDGIAFQTNILALNAAVEAARAGEQGRGFAVVAGEVRNLAQRSAEAAREIKSLIGTSVDKVEAGSRLVQDAGSTMGEIVASVQRVSDIIGEISCAAREQNQGIGQVNGTVVDLDRMTQQNAALVEESTAAASSLSDQAGRLRTVVATFRIEAAAR